MAEGPNAAENELNIEELIQAFEEALQFPLNDEQAPPGTVTVYALPPDDPTDELFEPITSFAITESGGYDCSPLTAEELKQFLGEEIDRRRNPTRTIETIRRYTNDIPGLFKQLVRLRHRIIQIRTCERDLTNLLKVRIKRMIKPLEKGRELPRIPHQLRLSALFVKAIDSVGSTGHLTAENFLSILRDGFPYGAAVDRQQVLQQLREVIESVDAIERNDRQNFHAISKKILKTINDILTEFMNEQN